jgi:hypothetical protein
MAMMSRKRWFTTGMSLTRASFIKVASGGVPLLHEAVGLISPPPGMLPMSRSSVRSDSR